MNNERRKVLCAIAARLLSLKHLNDEDMEHEQDFNEFTNDLESILYEEESYMDNMPENLQGGYRYQMAEEACDNIGCAIDALSDGNVDDAINYIYSAAV